LYPAAGPFLQTSAPDRITGGIAGRG